jgi:CHAT domain-containing protein
MAHTKIYLTAFLLSLYTILPASAANPPQTNSVSSNTQQTANNPLLNYAQTLNERGAEYLAAGRANLALDNWKEAHKIYTKVRDKQGIIGTEINQAQALQSLGFYHQALLNLRSVDTRLQKEPNSPLKVQGLLSLGNALRSLHLLDAQAGTATQGVNLGAKETLERALTIAKTSDDPAVIDRIKLSLANTLQLMGESQIQPAMDTYREVIATGAPLPKIQAKINLYRLESARQISPNTAQFIAEVSKELEVIPPSNSTVNAYINLAETVKKYQANNLIDRDSVMAVSKLLTTAISQARTIKYTRGEAESIGALGSLYQMTGQNKEAQKLTQQGLLIAESLPAPDLAYRLQWQLGKILTITSPNNPTAAISAYRQAVSNLKSLRNDLNSSDADLQFSFRDSVEPVYRELVALLLKDGEKTLAPNLEAARDLMESLQVAELENFLRQGCLDTYTVQLDKIDRSAAIVYPIVLPDRVAVITSVPKQPLRYYSRPISETEFEETINKLRTKIEDPEFTPEKEQAFQKQSKRVYDLLLAPVVADLQRTNTKTLVFVPDGILRNIPMSVLYDGSKYLVENYNLALTPGLQLVPPQNLLDRGRSQAFLGGISEARQGFPSLPGVKPELDSISKLIPSQKLINGEFNQNQVSTNLVASSSPIVHLATHGQFSSKPEDTFILTWDKKLDLNQLNNLLQNRNNQPNKAIDLLVLSACQTAAGDNRATLGLAGVAIRARAKSTIASLWSVSDDATGLLMTNLYQNLATQKLGKAESLKAAQLSLLKNPKYRSPFYWAPFVLVGNWQ